MLLSFEEMVPFTSIGFELRDGFGIRTSGIDGNGSKFPTPRLRPRKKKWAFKGNLPSRELTYPTLGKGKSSSKVPLGGDMLVSRRVSEANPQNVSGAFCC